MSRSWSAGALQIYMTAPAEVSLQVFKPVKTRPFFLSYLESTLFQLLQNLASENDDPVHRLVHRLVQENGRAKMYRTRFDWRSLSWHSPCKSSLVSISLLSSSQPHKLRPVFKQTGTSHVSWSSIRVPTIYPCRTLATYLRVISIAIHCLHVAITAQDRANSKKTTCLQLSKQQSVTTNTSKRDQVPLVIHGIAEEIIDETPDSCDHNEVNKGSGSNY